MLAAFDDLFVQKELALGKSLLPETYLLGDAQLLQKAVDNLIHNAITYSPYRVDTSRNRRTGGSGLGLYIVKTILNLHGGEIEIVNTLQGVLVMVSF